MKLVIWGGRSGLESHRWIHRAFAENASKIGISAIWVDDARESVKYLEPGVTVISADIYGKHLIPAAGVDYVLHNFDASHIVCQMVDPENILRLQVWTYDAFGEKWDLCRSYDPKGRILFQPWGADLLTEEFEEPTFNALLRDVVFVGAIWGEQTDNGDLGNEAAIEELKAVVSRRGFTFHHFTHISNAENVSRVRSARLAPTIAGGWQVEHGYLPCRAFKNSSYGVLMFTNVPALRIPYEECWLEGETVEELVDNALRLKRSEQADLVRAQQRVTARYTYRQSLDSIFRAIKEGK